MWMYRDKEGTSVTVQACSFHPDDMSGSKGLPGRPGEAEVFGFVSDTGFSRGRVQPHRCSTSCATTMSPVLREHHGDKA